LFRRNAEYPARPLLYDELRDIVQRGWELDGAIKRALGRDAVDEAQLEELNQKVSVSGSAAGLAMRGRVVLPVPGISRLVPSSSKSHTSRSCLTCVEVTLLHRYIRF
jgi:hypothetical protein